MARAANARFYDPEDPNSKVALEARCDIMYTVLSNEPGVWSSFVKLIEDSGQNLPFYTQWQSFEGIAMGVEFLAKCLKQRDYYIRSNESAQSFNQLAEARGIEFRDGLYSKQKIEEIDKAIKESLLPTAKAMAGLYIRDDRAFQILCHAYKETCLESMGYRCFALLLRFISFCQRHRLNPKEYGYIYQMLEFGDYSEMVNKPAPPPYRFVLLELREWTRRLAHFPEMKDTTINNEPPWFLDYEQGEYISYLMPTDVELASETDTRIEKVQRETWRDYKKRRDADTKQRGLKSYSGQRADSAAGDHDYWIYLYMVKGLSSDEIHKQLYGTAAEPNLEDDVSENEIHEPKKYDPDKDPDIPAIEKAISRRLKLAHIEFWAFGERRKFEKKYAKYKLET